MKQIAWLGVGVLGAWTLLAGIDRIIKAAEALPERTALDHYVDQADGSFSWKVVKSETSGGERSVVLDMTSQTWRTSDEVDRTKWRHWITLTIPAEVKSNIGFMWVGGGRNGKDPPDGPSEVIQKMARATQTVVAEVHMIPNQPLVFHHDGVRRSEDDLIAYTWVKFLETGDSTWPARNPMVKAVVRAMDAVTELTASGAVGEHIVDRFVVAGGSKRGWTTWLVGAVDERVAAIAPIVIDILNLEKSMNHQFAVYGFYTPAVGDYIEHKLMQKTEHPRIKDLYALVDPYRYRDRVTMPKFIMNAAGDEFFPPDHSRYYFDELRGEKYLRYVPNANHSLSGTDAIESVIAFYSLVLEGKRGPRFSWDRPNDRTLRVKTETQPKKVVLWQATNPHARDFRTESLGRKYESRVLDQAGDGVYVAEVSDPPAGYTAYFVELTYDVGQPFPLTVTTDVGIVPDVFLFADKDSTLPPSLSIRCVAPNSQAIAKLEEALTARAMRAIVEDPRLLKGREASTDRLLLTVNWAPKGRFEDGVRAIAGFLRDLGCKELTVRIESGRPLGGS